MSINSITKKEDFFSALHGTKYRGVLLDLYSRENGMGTSRLGIIISKKNLRRAVDRNLVKRHIRIFFQKIQSHLEFRDYIFRYKLYQNFDRKSIRKIILDDFGLLTLKYSVVR